MHHPDTVLPILRSSGNSYAKFSSQIVACCLPKGKLCNPPHEKGLIVLKMFQGWGGSCMDEVSKGGVGHAEVRWMLMRDLDPALCF